MNPREKGKRREREWAHFLGARGFPARRGQQHRGGADSPDVICEDLPYHWEVKGVEKLNVHKAIDQAIDECGENQTPVVAHKKSRRPWLVTLRAEDFVEMLRRIHATP